MFSSCRMTACGVNCLSAWLFRLRQIYMKGGFDVLDKG